MGSSIEKVTITAFNRTFYDLIPENAEVSELSNKKESYTPNLPTTTMWGNFRNLYEI